MTQHLSSTRLIVFISLFFMAFYNIAFFENIVKAYPLTTSNLFFVFSLFVVFGGFIVLLLSALCFKRSIKPVIFLLLILSSFAAYFMDSYNIIISNDMLDNAVKTDIAEVSDLLNVKLLLYVVLLGLLPGWLVYKLKIHYRSRQQEIKSRLLLIATTLVTLLVMIGSQGSAYASFFREHKTLRFYANPLYYLYSSGKFIAHQFSRTPAQLTPMGLDAVTPKNDPARELIVLVLGETARADHFSLNGYNKATNRYLQQEQVVSFNNVWSCGTSTAESLPCIFSFFSRAEYDKNSALSTENLLDVLNHAGVHTLWLDNNSDSKGVALRAQYESFKNPPLNTLCDEECRDEGMLPRIKQYIDEHPTGDIFIVLHQMGSHGPAYYKRYPSRFEQFKPVCKSNELASCSTDEIVNAYDNSIAYTDYFLSRVIATLKPHSQQFETAMLYVSDHGESLGEHGLYLHGLPYSLAPDSQKHVPLIMWFGDSFDPSHANIPTLKQHVNRPYSHQNITHTILGLFEINSTSYQRQLDILVN